MNFNSRKELPGPVSLL